MNRKLIPTINYDRVILHEQIPLSTPLVVYVELSGYCNFRCKFCPHGVGDQKKFKKSLMSNKLFRKLIDDLSVFPQKIKLLRICGNGEPLMNKDIIQMLQYPGIRKVVDKVELVTNGTLLNSSLIENLPRFLDRIIISVEGLSAQDYKRISDVTINFKEFLEKIAALYAAKGKCTLHIKIPSEAIKSNKDKEIFFDLFNDRCDEIYIENLVPMWPEYSIKHAKKEFRWGGQISHRRVCPQIFKSVQVQADGEVVPCCVDWNRVNLIGDITKNSLFEIWNGEKIRALQIQHLMGNKNKIEPCNNCTMNDYCEIDDIDSHSQECLERLIDDHTLITKASPQNHSVETPIV
ncbi:MAG: hypothetical protein DRG83_16350 [Deltaproteobacteria bacterium]|nr:MAG: hypothetical protein DRG83_16350 [Deltaproteobacteria bacterium]